MKVLLRCRNLNVNTANVRLLLAWAQRRTPPTLWVRAHCAAAECGQLGCVRALLDARAAIDACDPDGRRRCTWRVHRRVECIELLLQRRANPDAYGDASLGHPPRSIECALSLQSVRRAFDCYSQRATPPSTGRNRRVDRRHFTS